MSLLTLVALLACGAPPEDDALPLTLSESVRDVDEAETAYWTMTLTPPQRAPRRSPSQPFIDFSRPEITPAIGVAQYSDDFGAGVGFVGAVQFRVPVPGLPGGRWGAWGELFYATVDREDLAFYYESAGTAFGFGLGADFEFVYSQGFFIRAQVGYALAIFQDVAGVDDGGALLGGVSIGMTVNKARAATYSILYNPQVLYDSEDWILLHLFGLQIAF